MKTNQLYPLLLTLLCFFAAHAQQRVTVSTNEASHIMLKAVDEKVIFPEGITIYRSTDGQHWQKLTEKPLKMGAYTPTQEELKSDTLLRQYVELSHSLSSEKQEGATLLVVMLKALESTPFARYLGIAYVDEQVEGGKAYTYKVSRLVKGVEQQLEITAPVTVAPFTPAASPDSVKVQAKDGVVTVTWLPNPLQFWAVNIYRSSSVDTVYRQVNKLPLVASTRTGPDGKEGYASEFYADATVNNSMVYKYCVAGIDFFGRETQRSEPVEARPQDKTPPLFPDKVKGEVDKLQVNLSWDNSLQSDDMWGYYVYRGTSYYHPFERVSGLLPAANNLYTDTVKEPGGYYYYVAAVDFAGNEGKSAKISVEVPDVFPPAKPRVISVIADSGQMTIRWHSNHEKDLMGYQLYRASNGASSSAYVPINPKPLTDTVFTDRLPFVAKNFFYYRLYAIDQAYNRSEPADVVYARMPDVVAPQQPFIKEARQMESSLVVEWIPNTDDDLMGYNIYRFEANKEPASATRINATLIDAKAFRFTDRFPIPNVLYKYYLTAVDSTGNISIPSGYYGAMLAQDEGESVTVKQLKAKCHSRKKVVELTWELEPDDVDGYKGCMVYRRTANSNFVPLSGLEKMLKYKDNTVIPGESYNYQIRTYTASGHNARSVAVEVAVEEKK